MTRFNLTFRGKILAGHDRQQVEARLAELFAITEPARLSQCFSGDLVILRRDLNRKDAADFYARLRRMGLEAELVKIPERNGVGNDTPSRADPAAEVARRKAEERRRKKEKKAQRAAEHERARAEAAARREAERAARAEERARLAELQRQRREEEQRAAAEKAAQRDALRREREQQAAQARLEAARRKREQAAAAARRKAEEARQRAEEKARIEAVAREQEAQRRAMEQQAEQRAAQELTHITASPAANRVRTRLELPSRKRATETDPYAGRRKRQPGEPNLFSLTPFRNSPEVRQRAGLARQRLRGAAAAAIISLACVLFIALQLPGPPADSSADGALDVAISPRQEPVLLAAGQLLRHDRAGVGTAVLTPQQLGARLQQPLAFTPDGALLAPGRLAGSGDEPTLLRCELAGGAACEAFSTQLAGTTVSALAVNPLDGSVFIADGAAGELLKLDSRGALLARAGMPLPRHPVLRLDAGLLLVNSALGPALSVLRYENESFAEQLDEIMLLPGEGASAHTAVRDFLRQGDQWWALLGNERDQAPELFRFDSSWNSLGKVRMPHGAAPAQLVSWGNRVLAREPGRMPLLKFNADGDGEAPLASSLLTELAAQQQRRADLERLAWRLALALAVLTLIASGCLAGLYRMRSLVYTSSREQGAVPLDQQAAAITWVAHAANHRQRLVLLARGYCALALAAILLAIGLGASALQLSALLVALAGPAAALLLLQRSEPGHIGTSGDTLVLADHRSTYHLGSGSRVHYRAHFLMIDDVTVFIGNGLLPVFDPAGLRAQVVPLARRGIQVDRRFLTVRLLQGRHPLAVGIAIILACASGALALLSLPGAV